MVRLIADSGSTKTDWCLINGDAITYYKTQGLNPYFLNQTQVTEILRTELVSKLPLIKVDEIYFFGSGCTLGEKCDLIKSSLSEVFKSNKIEVTNDLLGAAKGLAQHHEGIVLILGTGSNSGFYDGGKIIEQVSSLGYLLGDEGSGSRIGKKLSADYFRNKMPAELSKKFALSFQLSTSSELLKIIFQQNHQGKYLASFAKFALENKDNDYIKMIIQKEFNHLFEEVIMAYNKTAHRIYATGSIAFYFEHELKKAAENFNYKIALIKQSPIEGLAEYFSKYETNG
ncbi:MAG: hypothetical protein RL065_365 [Bacteroidota bacterium]|jgi:N-acetylglucosamine kinase-like BadF-type ATPase